ncbi:MAG: hypothetical protein L0154_06100 [Chloroflexi bacterium]|nr:hypothetical protein [Chloroflexota bacterium]
MRHLLCLLLLFTAASPVAARVPERPTVTLPQQNIPELPSCEDEPDMICEVERTFTVDELEAHQGEVVWLDGDVFIFSRKHSGNGTVLVGDIVSGLRPIPDSLWFALAVKIPRWEEAILNFGYLPIVNNRFQWGALTYNDWRGPDAPEPLPTVDELAGTLRDFTLDSEFLDDGTRQITVYLPPEYDENGEYPVVYLSDGSVVWSYSPIVEAAILNGDVPHLILVGIHAHPPDPTGQFNFRGHEYLPWLDEETDFFENHEQFVIEEVIPWAEERFAVATDRNQRAIFGLSDGASFSLTMAQNHPDLFGNALVFSLGWSGAEYLPTEEPIRYYLVTGTLETAFFEATTRWAEVLDEEDVQHVLKVRVSGHNQHLWREEFPAAVAWIFDQ